ncbi:MAG: hypothetical protein QNJ74_27320 [Trichodesmium sp. MO_231.B1]|nr:hypothetical protein [Trichodesmium sp. MO_231.B1]
MNQVLEYIYNHPKETKRIIGITDKQLIKLIENAQKIEENIHTSDDAPQRTARSPAQKKD